MSFVVVIPARYQSTRLPGKPLIDIAGMSMIERVYRQALQSGAQRVVIATDDARIEQVAEGFGAEVVMTSPDHESGTERLGEVCDKLQLAADTVVVNVQGDEPLIPPSVIAQVAELLEGDIAQMATLSAPIAEADLNDPNVVKVISDSNGHAIYFSRSAIPFQRDPQQGDQFPFARHIGIYGYRAGFIRRYLSWQPSLIEQVEKLEQLRVLWHGEKIRIAEAQETPAHGVDTQEDLEKVRALLGA